MRKRLLLITNGFPYGNSERSFLLTEYNDLLKEFDVHTLALSWQPILDEQVDIMNAQWLLLERPSVVDALLQAGKPAVIREMWSARQLCGRNAYLKRLKAIAAYSARTALIEEKVAELCEANAIDIIYTYWCTYATLASVRLKKDFRTSKSSRASMDMTYMMSAPQRTGNLFKTKLPKAAISFVLFANQV